MRESEFNDFVIIGPANDPARVRGVKSAAEAFHKIVESACPFVSRGDKSGTHTKELSIWEKTGTDPKGQKWYLEVGQGMEKTQRIANEKRAYTLTDRGTWLATKDKDKLEMIIALEGDPTLFNQYGVMAVNPQRHKHVKYKEATAFIDWLISKEGQQAIASYSPVGWALPTENPDNMLGRQVILNAELSKGTGGKYIFFHGGYAPTAADSLSGRIESTVT
ncbi:MAG: substrate-binding domain-containing protein [Desulfovibrionales bacterium]|nr:substrate-binding domain-containing protein [Desulfovibrionales bacterium]